MFARRSVISLSFLLAVAVPLSAALPTRLYADDAKPDAPASNTLRLKPGKFKGTLVDLDGKTPIKGCKVELYDASGKLVQEATTDESGTFELGDSPAGDYDLAAGSLRAKVSLDPAAQATSLKLVIDPLVASGAKPAAAAKVAGVSVTGTVLIALGVAIVAGGAGFGVGWAVWGSGKSQSIFIPVGRPVSP